MEEQKADHSPPAYRDVVLTPMPFLQSPLPEHTEITGEQETGDDVALISPDPHQPHEPPPSTPHLQPITYTQPPPQYSLRASYYIAAPLPQQQNQQQQQVMLSTLCPEKNETKIFFVISPIKLGHFWWNLVHRFTNKFAAKSLFMCYVAPSLRYGSFLDNFPCHTAGVPLFNAFSLGECRKVKRSKSGLKKLETSFYSMV